MGLYFLNFIMINRDASVLGKLQEEQEYLQNIVTSSNNGICQVVENHLW